MPPDERWQMTGSGAEAYERYLVPAMFAPRATLLLDLVRLQSGERMLDAPAEPGEIMVALPPLPAAKTEGMVGHGGGRRRQERTRPAARFRREEMHRLLSFKHRAQTDRVAAALAPFGNRLVIELEDGRETQRRSDRLELLVLDRLGVAVERLVDLGPAAQPLHVGEPALDVGVG
jgi:hypothetical protein